METRISAETISAILHEEQMKNTKAGCGNTCEGDLCSLIFCSNGSTECHHSCPDINPANNPLVCYHTQGSWDNCWDFWAGCN